MEFVEQPLPAHDIEGLRFVRERSCAADRRRRELPRLDRHPAARRRGGRDQHQAREVRRAARSAAHDRDGARARMLVMCGCMIESSLGITAAAQLAPLLDCADLDGAALVANDPYVGATIEGGVVGCRRGGAGGDAPVKLPLPVAGTRVPRYRDWHTGSPEARRDLGRRDADGRTRTRTACQVWPVLAVRDRGTRSRLWSCGCQRCVPRTKYSLPSSSRGIFRRCSSTSPSPSRSSGRSATASPRV